MFKPGSEVVKDFYAELPISIKVVGAYHDLGAFAGDIARLPRIVTLNDINVEQPKSADTLMLVATAKTFRYLDEEEVATQKRIEKDKKTKGAKK